MIQLTAAQVKDLCLGVDYDNGTEYVRQGKVSDTWQTETSLHAAVAGSGQQPYRVSIEATGAELTPRCTCPAHRRRPFCKHVVATLILWVQSPERFVAGEARPAVARQRPESQVRRAPKARVDRHQVQLDGLGKIEELLVELTSYGLLSVTEAQVARVADLAHAAESHTLRRLARLVARLALLLGTACPGPGQPAAGQVEEKAYAELLSDAWLTAQATRRALENPDADPTMLEELVGKTWREKDLERRGGLRLLELAYQSVELDTGFTVDTSYLLSLEDGALYVEKQIVPSGLKNQARKPSHTTLLAGTAGLYPGSEPRRIKMVDVAPAGLSGDGDWQQALAHAERSVAALFCQFQAATAGPLAPPEAYTLFAPAQILVAEPQVWLRDGEGQAIPLAGGWRIVGHLTGRPVAAVFGRTVLAAAGLQLAPLSLLSPPPNARLVRLATPAGT